MVPCENSQHVIDLATQAGTDLVIFPELTLTVRICPKILLYRADLLALVEQGLADIMAAAYPGVIVVGHPWREGGQLFNAASVIQQGQLLGRYYKQALPNFGVFDEQRYFTPGQQSFTFELKQQTFAVLICEDVWQRLSGCGAKAAGGGLGLWCSMLHLIKLAKIAQRQELPQYREVSQLQLGFV